MATASNRRRRFRPLISLAAAISLCVWLAAVTLCTAHCALGFGRAEDGHVQSSSCCHHGSNKAPVPNQSPSCQVFKSALANGKANLLLEPKLFLVYSVAAVRLIDDPASIHALTLPFRQTLPNDWIARPEVYLCAATFSLAPPVLS
jgi:hypothetical protein